MDQALVVANHMAARADASAQGSSAARPPAFKAVGISLAIASGAFIGTSFVLKKAGLLKANEKYKEIAGEGYGYLKNFYWWAGMVLMIVGEICNFVAYAFTDAILVTPLGALAVVITTILSAIFLKERLSLVGQVSCFLCIIGSVIIVMNAPESSSVANIQEMQHYVISPGFLTYAGLIIVGSAFTAFYCGPRWGKKNMFVYISICSWVGGLSVVATQGLGAAVVAQVQGTAGGQFTQWFLYVLLVFVVGTLLTEIIFLNKALNIYNAAMVTPTYYVYFTSTTIITSAVLFRGFKGTPTSIITVVMGFLVICSGVVLLQLSKSAKDVPDTAVFTGDLNQIQTIAEQEQPETEPKADAIRGAAAIVRRLSQTRQRMEADELRRLHEEKEKERLMPVSEDGKEQFEWDGIRRRRTTRLGSGHSRASPGHVFTTPPPSAHPPLGWSHFPTEEELEERGGHSSGGLFSSIAGTIRGRSRSASVALPGHPDYRAVAQKGQSSSHPVQLTDITVPGYKLDFDHRPASPAPAGAEHIYGLPPGLRNQKTAYGGTAALVVGAASIASGSTGGRVELDESTKPPGSSHPYAPPPTPPAHVQDGKGAQRQFSFQGLFRRHAADGVQDPDHTRATSMLKPPSRSGMGSRGYSSPLAKQATEEERLGLVKGDTRSTPALPHYADMNDDEDDGDHDAVQYLEHRRAERNERRLNDCPPGWETDIEEREAYEANRRRWENTGRHWKDFTTGGSPSKAQGSRSPPKG